MATMRNVWTLEENERSACTVLSRMKSSDNDTFDKCDENDRIYETAKCLLNGENPIEFAIEVLKSMWGPWCNENELRRQYGNYLN